MTQLLWLLCLLLVLNSANAQLSIKNNPIVGGVVVLDYRTNNKNIQAFYGRAQLYTQRLNHHPSPDYQLYHHQIFVGIPLLTQAGTKQIKVIDSGTKTLEFMVNDYPYQAQHIYLSGDKKKYIKPGPSRTKRIISERHILQKARAHFDNQHYAKSLFLRPATAIITGTFGKRRFYNGRPGRPHTGIDYAIPSHTPIRAPEHGKIILTGVFFFNGKTIFLDHGRGLISAFIHLSKILVKKGDFIRRGQIIAQSGETGRATAPHLHWSLYLNQIAINPQIFVYE